MTRNTDTISELDEKWLEIEKKLCNTYLDKIPFSSSGDEAENNEIKKNILNFLRKIFDYSLDVKLQIGNKDNYDSRIISHATYNDPEKRAIYLNNLFLQFSKNVISDLSRLGDQVNLLDDKVCILLTALFSKIHEELAKKLQDKSPEQKKEFLEYRQLFFKEIIKKTSKDFQKIFNKSSENLQLYIFEHTDDPNIPKDQVWLSRCLALLAKKLKEKLTEDQKTTYNSFIENLQDLFSTAISLKLQITEEQAKEDPTQSSIFQTTYDNEHERSEFIKKIFEHKAQTIIDNLSEFSRRQNIDHQTLTTLKEQYFEFFKKYFSDKLSALKEDKLDEFIKLREYFFKKLEEADTQKILFDDSNLAKETFKKLISNGQEIISRKSPNPQGSDANQDSTDPNKSSDSSDKTDYLQKVTNYSYGNSIRLATGYKSDKNTELDDQLESLDKSTNALENLLIQIKSKLIDGMQANLQELSSSNVENFRTTEVATTLTSQESKPSETTSDDFNSQNFQDQSTQTQDQEHVLTTAEINPQKEIDQKNKLIEELQSSIYLLTLRVQELESSNDLLSQIAQEKIDNLLKITFEAKQLLSHQQTQYQLLNNQKEELEKEKEELNQIIQKQNHTIELLHLQIQANTNYTASNEKMFDTTKLQPNPHSPIYSGPYTSESFNQSNPDHNQEGKKKEENQGEDNGGLVSPQNLNQSDSDYQEIEDAFSQSIFSLDDPSRNRLLPRVLNPIPPSRLSESDLIQPNNLGFEDSTLQDHNGKTNNDADPHTTPTHHASPDPATDQENSRFEISSSQPSQNFLLPGTDNSKTDPEIINSHETLTKDQAPDTNKRSNTVTYHEPIEATQTLKTTPKDQSWSQYLRERFLGNSPNLPSIVSAGRGRSIDEGVKPLGGAVRNL